jgi:fructose-1,6-bisphosphatase/inositol monophosphatase family enzyme
VVTETDLAVEALLRERIAAAFPDDGILGEEYGEQPGTSGRRWIIDPIDGTEAFVHGVGQFSTLVALEDEHGIAAGAIEVPVMGETLWAGRGQGAFLNGNPISMSATTSPRGVLVTTSAPEEWSDEVLAAARALEMQIRTWSGGFGIGLALSGRVDAWVDFSPSIWDLAPADVIATEAGGVCVALDGTRRLDAGDCLVAPRGLSPALLEVFGGFRPAE